MIAKTWRENNLDKTANRRDYVNVSKLVWMAVRAKTRKMKVRGRKCLGCDKSII